MTGMFETFRARWNRDVINTIVLGLNNGESIRDLLIHCAEKGGCDLENDRDLRGIDLSFQNLRGPWYYDQGRRCRSGVDLSGTDLSGADLTWTILPRACLKGCRLKGACLRDTELILADLTDADLTDADLTGAWLLDTRLQGAAVTPEQLRVRRNLGQMDFDYHAFEL